MRQEFYKWYSIQGENTLIALSRGKINLSLFFPNEVEIKLFKNRKPSKEKLRNILEDMGYPDFFLWQIQIINNNDCDYNPEENLEIIVDPTEISSEILNIYWEW